MKKKLFSSLLVVLLVGVVFAATPATAGWFADLFRAQDNQAGMAVTGTQPAEPSPTCPETRQLAATPIAYAGADIDSVEEGHAICQRHFGPEWQWSEWHDDPDGVWAMRGNLLHGEFDQFAWIWINDQRSECFSTGDQYGLTFYLAQANDGCVYANCHQYEHLQGLSGYNLYAYMGDIKCNPYYGDTSCDAKLPLLCTKKGETSNGTIHDQCRTDADCEPVISHCTCSWVCASELQPQTDCDLYCSEIDPTIPDCSCVDGECVGLYEFCEVTDEGIVAYGERPLGTFELDDYLPVRLNLSFSETSRVVVEGVTYGVSLIGGTTEPRTVILKVQRGTTDEVKSMEHGDTRELNGLLVFVEAIEVYGHESMAVLLRLGPGDNDVGFEPAYTCSGNQRVHHYCDGDDPSTTYLDACQHGCANGACLSEVPVWVCKDSDGLDTSRRGEVGVGGQVYTDTCTADGSRVKEYACSFDDELLTLFSLCTHGCVDGACVDEPMCTGVADDFDNDELKDPFLRLTLELYEPVQVEIGGKEYYLSLPDDELAMDGALISVQEVGTSASEQKLMRQGQFMRFLGLDVVLEDVFVSTIGGFGKTARVYVREHPDDGFEGFQWYWCGSDGNLMTRRCLRDMGGSGSVACPNGCFRGECLPAIPECVDTDGGFDPFSFGVATGVAAWGSSSVPGVFADYCRNSRELNEMACVDGLVQQHPSVACEFGCGNGACLLPNLTGVCVDSDGVDPFTLGNVSSGQGSLIDACVDADTVTEHFCYGDVAFKADSDCSNGCSAGRCAEEPRCDLTSYYSAEERADEYDIDFSSDLDASFPKSLTMADNQPFTVIIGDHEYRLLIGHQEYALDVATLSVERLTGSPDAETKLVRSHEFRRFLDLDVVVEDVFVSTMRGQVWSTSVSLRLREHENGTEWFRVGWCEGDAPKILRCSAGGSTIDSYGVPCPYGCEDGVCLPDNGTSACYDSDGGEDYYERGRTTYAGVTETDRCLPSPHLYPPSFDAADSGALAGERSCVPSEEVCDGLDNDCDGVVDEGCQCLPGELRVCGHSDVGVCVFGEQACDNDGLWGSCVGAVLPTVEVCDGLDNDCDGVVDEGCSDDDWLVEWVCDPDGAVVDGVFYGGVRPVFHLCEHGCSAGACLVGVSVPVPKPVPEPVPEPAPEPVCDGCSLDGKCVPYGYRTTSRLHGPQEVYYCDLSGDFLVARDDAEACLNDYECATNLCVNDRCVSKSFWNRMMEFLARWF
ncbi:hypothetical protein JXA12_06030 [Candidatus Woesearchaeota archaeon]|nr:hypothetical protein [Candidatus Woesearchaeota archaeon]